MKSFSAYLLTVIFALVTAAPLPICAAHRTSDRAAAARQTSAPSIKIRLPERFRLLTDQRFDLRVEAVGLSAADATIKVTLDGADASTLLNAPEVSADNDMDAATIDRAWVYRRWSFSRAGVREVKVSVMDGERRLEATARIGVQPFALAPDFKNIILFIGDGMGTAYRDAARIVAKSANNGLREGFFTELLHMDSMPVSGMILTHSLDRLAPDSANTASAWATGNKTVDNALAVLPDNNDARFNRADVQGTKRFALDNPRIETLWEYLKRRHDYRTGIVTTADVTDATPAACAAHTIERTLYDDIARQYVEGATNLDSNSASVTTTAPNSSATKPAPAFDVILGGGRDRFSGRSVERNGDARDLASELQTAGWTYVQTRSELKTKTGESVTKETTNAAKIPTSNSSASNVPAKMLGLFRNGAMNNAYDKLGLPRPADEPRPQFENATDQPFLDEMTTAAISVLRRDQMPFILLVEAASIDKQSHSNHATGQIWDTIELDRAIGTARRIVAADERLRQRTLMIVTADHDQSMSILGTIDTQAEGAVTNVRSTMQYPLAPTAATDVRSGGRNGIYGEHGANQGETSGFPDYKDANADGYPENDNRFRIGVGYRTTNHTASSVPITAEGAGALLFTGYFDQTDLFFKIAHALGTDTAPLDRSLDEMRKARVISVNY